MPEDGVIFNSDPLPPPEYLMRRSFNPNDAQFPGAVVRIWTCELCRKGGRETTANYPGHCPFHEDVPLVPAAVDVPLLKADGERWK